MSAFASNPTFKLTRALVLPNPNFNPHLLVLMLTCQLWYTLAEALFATGIFSPSLLHFGLHRRHLRFIALTSLMIKNSRNQCKKTS